MKKIYFKERDHQIVSLNQSYHYLDVYMGDRHIASIMVSEEADEDLMRIHVWDEVLEDPVVQLSGRLDEDRVVLRSPRESKWLKVGEADA